MDFLNSLAAFLWGLFDFLFSPFRWINEQFRESPRTRSFLYSIPALFAATTGVALVTASQIGRERELIDEYHNLASSKHNEYLDLLDNLNESRRLLRSSGATDPLGDDPAISNRPTTANSIQRPQLVPRFDRIDIKSLPEDQQSILRQMQAAQIDEQTLLLKLISLDPENKSYRYRYAMAFEGSWSDKQVELMRQLAPEETAGYADAHFWMASWYFTMPVNSLAQNRQMKNKALIHAKHCLTLDKTKNLAEVIRGNSLFALQRYSEALESFKRLFTTEPEFFEAIAQTNVMLGKPQDNFGIFELAAQKLESKIRTVRSTSISDWTVAIQQYVQCMVGINNFERLDEFLEGEEKRATGDQNRLAFLNRERARALSEFARIMLSKDNAAANLPRVLQFLKRSLELVPENDVTKYQIAFIAMTQPSIREEALKVYDPNKEKDIPGLVLMVMGNAEMQQRNYSAAVARYEEARRKLPRNADLLNNLAYALLLHDAPSNAKRALTLVDEALSMVPRQNETAQILSTYLHTRGSALLAMGQLNEAASSFELSLQSRPDNEGVLESLIQCYKERDPVQASTYQKRLDEVRAKKDAAEQPAPTGG